MLSQPTLAARLANDQLLCLAHCAGFHNNAMPEAAGFSHAKFFAQSNNHKIFINYARELQ